MRSIFGSRFLFRSLAAFIRSESGMTLPLLGMSMIMLTATTGAAIDTARLQLVQSKLQASLDAAGLAAGSTVSTSNLNQEVTKYLNVNFNGYLGATVMSATATATSNNNVINLSATATLQTTFLQVVGITSMTAKANSQITRAASGLELVMVLDNTGSMANDGKLAALKTAATTLVDIITGGQNSISNLWMGLVPFSQAVNIGSGNTDWLDASYSASLNWGPSGGWAGCVDSRVVKAPPVKFIPGSALTIDQDITDDPPSITPFNQYFYHSDDANCWVKTKKNGNWKCTDTGSGTPQYYGPYNTTSNGPNLYCPQQMTPMTGNAITITNAINTMTAQGNTHIPLGLAWGWRMLSPRWQGLWGGAMNANGLPLNYHTKSMNKALVLLTDGMNTMGCKNSSWSCAQDRTAYGYLEDGMLGTSNMSTAVTQLNDRMIQICSSLKANGVYVYTIALDTSSNPIDQATIDLLKNCATAPNYAFRSPSATQLKTIFSQIGDSLSSLRVSK
ncbi:MAG: pilus assembly protein TadG-related protein [Bdellovibrionales bacterium]